jgi:hypothetical protein
VAAVQVGDDFTGGDVERGEQAGYPVECASLIWPHLEGLC